MADVAPDPAHLRSETRGVSTALGYTLNLAVATILVTGLLVGAGGYVEDQQERAIRTELDVIGARVAGELAAVDRLARTGDDVRVSVTVETPVRSTGATYTIAINESGNREVVLQTEDPAVRVTVPYHAETTVDAGTTQGGTFVLRYDPATDSVVIGDG